MAAKRTRKKQQKQKKQEERKELVIDGLRDARPLVEVRDLGQKGLGVIAISDIPRGTRVIAESDLLQVNRSTVDAKEVVRAFEKLPLSEQNLYLELYAYASPEYKSAAERELEQSWEQIPQLHRKVLEIYAANAFGGVFLLSSRINHSCIPNLHFAYNPELLKETFHAIRDITAGEELTIMYIKGTNRTRSQRQAELNRWGFQCTCLACEDTSQGKEREKKRSQLFDLDQKLALDALMSTEASYVKSLQAAQKMAAIQQSEGLLNRDLGVSYHDAARYSLRLNNTRMALMWAKKELEVDHYCIGEDHPEYKEGFQVVRLLEAATDGVEPVHESVARWYQLHDSSTDQCVVM